MSTDVPRSSIEKQESTDDSEKRDRNTNAVDFGGDTMLPPPPKLTADEEHKLYRKIDLRCVGWSLKVKAADRFRRPC